MVKLAVFFIMLLFINNVFMDESFHFGQCGKRPLVQHEQTGSPTVGSTEAVPGNWPWIVSIQEPLDDGFGHVCGGTVLNNHWVLTAAHCFHNRSDTFYSWRVMLGQNQLTDVSNTTQIRKIAVKIQHEEYNPNIQKNDIALLRLDKPIEFSDHIQPACLPGKNKIVRRMTECHIAGWGITTEASQEASDILQEVSVGMVFPKLCNSTNWYNGLVGEYNLCAGFEHGNINSCQGESGGPLMCREKADPVYSVMGVGSWGFSCSHGLSQGVYTSTQFYLDWIIKNVESDKSKLMTMDIDQPATPSYQDHDHTQDFHKLDTPSGALAVPAISPTGRRLSAKPATEAKPDPYAGETVESLGENFLRLVKQAMKIISLQAKDGTTT
ncbi:acrosin-like [Rhinophrynus dorsalis]